MGFAGLDAPHHDLAAVHPYPNLNRQTAFGTIPIRIAFELLLHAQRRIQRTLGMVLIGDRRSEHREDAVAGGLGDVAAVALYRLHHQIQCRIDDGPGFLRVEILHELHGALDVGKQYRHRLALALKRSITSSEAHLYRRTR